jgi:transmembrane sensor
MKTLRGFDPNVLAPPLDEERVAREYEIVRQRTLRRRQPKHWAAWAAAAAAITALVAVVAFERRAPKLVDSAVLVAGASEEPVRVALPEGSSVELAPNTRAKLTSVQPKAIRIDVETGSVDIEATHVAGRTFVVGAGSYEVRVTGTHFRVQRIPGERVSVHVDQGVVEVVSAGDKLRRLGAGEQWSAPDNPGALNPPASEAPSSEPLATSPGVSLAGGLVASASAPAGPVPAAATVAPKDAKDLFEQAQHARSEGRTIDAARAFDKVRRTYRKDPHAALAAFELGRLRLDVLGDPVGAEEALEDAVVLGPESPLREDAEARRVEALSRAGDGAGCASARDAYLAHWPSGAYRRTVELYCSK